MKGFDYDAFLARETQTSKWDSMAPRERKTRLHEMQAMQRTVLEGNGLWKKPFDYEDFVERETRRSEWVNERERVARVKQVHARVMDKRHEPAKPRVRPAPASMYPPPVPPPMEAFPGFPSVPEEAYSEEQLLKMQECLLRMAEHQVQMRMEEHRVLLLEQALAQFGGAPDPATWAAAGFPGYEPPVVPHMESVPPPPPPGAKAEGKPAEKPPRPAEKKQQLQPAKKTSKGAEPPVKTRSHLSGVVDASDSIDQVDSEMAVGDAMQILRQTAPSAKANRNAVFIMEPEIGKSSNASPEEEELPPLPIAKPPAAKSAGFTRVRSAGSGEKLSKRRRAADSRFINSLSLECPARQKGEAQTPRGPSRLLQSLCLERARPRRRLARA